MVMNVVLTDLQPTELRTAVRERYAAMATHPDRDHSFRVGRAFAEALGYPADLLDTVPPGTSEAFTGVATPVFRANLRPGEVVLDLGCGAGLDLILAARAVGPSGRAIGIDIAEPMVQRAEQSLAALGLRHAEARVAFAEALPLADASIDCVLANGILNLTPDKAGVLAEVARVLRPGGRFVLAETTLRYELPLDGVRHLDDWFR
jgi:SAM-dependent methyltransferase